MLFEIIESTKNKLVVELYMERSLRRGNQEKRMRFDMVKIFLDLLNYKKGCGLIAQQIENQNLVSATQIKEFIDSLKIKKETKKFLKFFCFLNGKVYAPHLRKTEYLLSDVKLMIDKIDITTEIMVECMNIKYSPRRVKSTEDKHNLIPIQPILFANNIDTEYLNELVSRIFEGRTNRAKIFEWLMPQIENEIQRDIIGKLYLSTFSNLSENYLYTLSFEELLEYLVLKAKYENNCTKYKVAFMDEVLVLAFQELLHNNISIKKCESCKKYFISQFGTKCCSPKCKEEIKKANEKIRNNNDIYVECNNATKKVRDRVTYYEGKCEDLPKDCSEYIHRTQICSAFKFVYHYYCWVANKIKEAALNNIDGILNDMVFKENLYQWLEMISSQICDLDNTNSTDDIVFYKFSREHFSKEKFNVLLSNKFFIREVNYIFTEQCLLEKKKTSQKNK